MDSIKNENAEWYRLFMTPGFCIRHPNGRGTGSALAMRSYPARAMSRNPGDDCTAESGFVRLAVADQLCGTDGRDAAMDYEWSKCIQYDMSPVDIAKMLMVFTGFIEKTGSGWSGDNRISSKTADRLLNVSVDHRVEPEPGYVLTVSRHVRGDCTGDLRRQITLTSAEALCLSEALRGVMPLVAFGTPAVSGKGVE